VRRVGKSASIDVSRKSTLTDDTLSPTETVSVDGAPNFRDIGGYETADGRRVRYGKLFRSGMLVGVSDEGVATLEALGIRTVVDLRTQVEVDALGPDRLPKGTRVVQIRVPSAGADPMVAEALRTGHFPYLPDLVSVNRAYIADDAVQFGDLLTLLADTANLPAVVHCLGGKDRTGVSAALLLAVLGVPWPTVRRDYLRSNVYFADSGGDQPDSLNRAMEKNLGHAPDFGDEESRRRFFVLRPEYIDVVLDEITKGGRTFDEFVRNELRLSAATVERLRAGFLE
jgi:protein-tyrosine phosphatase